MVLLALLGLASGGAVSSAADPLPPISWNDNREGAGTWNGETLTLDLEVRRGLWHVLGQERPPVEVLAFGERGKELRIPGPMVRVPLGSRLRVTLSNPLDAPLVVRGLGPRRVAVPDSLIVRPGERIETSFRVDAEGTYYYRGRLADSPTAVRAYEDHLLAGAFVVDPARSKDAGTAREGSSAEGKPTDRVFVMQIWFDGQEPNGDPDLAREFLTINGRPWPYTERLTYDLGEEVRWRVINASGAPHPMHLHGFFFEVESRGDIARDTLYWPEQRRMAVTERMAPGTTMALRWTPDRPGGWIFHCHNSFHVVPNPALGTGIPTSAEHANALLKPHARGDANDHAVEGMGGLLLAIYVRPPDGWVSREPRRRTLRLFVQSDSAGSAPADAPPVALAAPFRRRFGYVLQEGAEEPAPDSVRLPGSPIVLWKGEPASITVINRTSEPTQVHWHGLEIESYFDGVAGIGGYPGRLTPAILPGDSFEMRITPPRAGSYMYHTHVNDIRQQSAGLYGAFVVLDRDAEWDPETDRIFLAGLSPSEPGVMLNGTNDPDPITFRAGTTYRLRVMNITLFNAGLTVSLTRGGAPVRWIPLAKDGWDLPAHERRLVRAERIFSVGETFDYSFTPNRPGDLRLEIRSSAGRLFVEQAIRVIEGDDADDRGEAPAGGG